MAEEALTSAPTASKLNELVTAANLQYAKKHYNEAADLYSTATEMQAALNGEMAPENAELLYLYGRCLYHVAVGKSDVLGGKVAGEGEKKKKSQGNKQNGEGSNALASAEQKLAEEVVEAAVESKEGMESSTSGAAATEPTVESKPYFQITGDENFDTDSEDDEGEDGDAEGAVAEEDDDDFANAFEILDYARVLFTNQLESLSSSEDDSRLRYIKERLADTRDLQAEISLENERFTDATADFRASLELKQQLHPEDSSILAEAHFKLSLALEFASVTAVREAQAADDKAAMKDAKVDEEVREEAAKETEAAIRSCKLRIAREEKELEALEGQKAETKRKGIKDVKEMVEELEQRLVDLRNPVVPVSDPAVAGLAGVPDGSNPLHGILGSILGESPAEQRARIEEATKSANDLSNLVRKKKPQTAAQSADAVATNGRGKRRLEDIEEESEGKRAKPSGDV